MAKLDTILDDAIERNQVRAAIYNMLSEAVAELIEKDTELSVGTLLTVINKKIEEL